MMKRSLFLLTSCFGLSLGVLLPLRHLLGVAFVPRHPSTGHLTADDIDGDGTAEIFLAARGETTFEWRIVKPKSTTKDSFSLGPISMIPALGDYDGDGRTDFGFYQPKFQDSAENRANWKIWLSDPEKERRGVLPSVVDRPLEYSWGTGAHVAVPADYDGDGRTDLAVFDPKEAIWFVALMSGGPNLAKASLNLPGFGIVRQWGLPGDLPAPADYDGDKKTDFAVVRRAGGKTEWLIMMQSGGEKRFNFGEPGDVPLPADYNADGTSEAVVYHPPTGAAKKGEWRIYTEDEVPHTIGWCGPGYEPIARDYDGDGRADAGCFSGTNPSDWDILHSRLGWKRTESFRGFEPAGIILRRHQLE